MGTASAAPRDLPLVVDGEPNATVVLAEGATDPLRAAAADLVRVIERMSGARLRIVATPEEAWTFARILLGERLARERGVSLDGVGPEGYVIKRVGNDLVIAGVRDTGTAHGVYGLLTDVLGVRWLLPGELWEIVPRRLDVTVGPLDAVVNPSFGYRVFSGVTDGRWRARNRVTYNAWELPHFGFGHNLKRIIVPSKYGKEHPEYFAEINGKRFVPDSDESERSEPCFTNREVIDITIDTARKFFDANPSRTTFSLCINDNADFCTCANCSALDSPRRKWRTGYQYSDSYFHYVTEVAKGVAETHPDRYLGCYAYWPVELPPRRIKRLPDNVVIALTQDTSQHFDPAYRDRDRKMIRLWQRSAAHVGKYDYYGLGWMTPRYYPHQISDDLRFCREQGVVGMYCEAYPYWAITGPMVYLGARMMWDADNDGDAALDECMRLAFGNAAAEMREFYDLLETIWTRPRQGRWFQGLDNIRVELAMVDATAMARAWHLLRGAEGKATGEAAARIKYVRDGFEFSYLLATIYGGARAAAERSLRERADLDQMMDRLLAISERIDEPQQVFDRNLASDPNYQHAYFQGTRFSNKMVVWREEVKAQLLIALRRALAWAESSLDPAECDRAIDRLAIKLSKSPPATALGLTDFVRPAVTVPRVARPLSTVDGDLREWEAMREYQLTPAAAQLKREIGGEGDCSARCALAWDRRYLYFACRVRDNVFRQTFTGTDIWREDSVQLAIDPLHDGAESPWGYGADDYEYGFALTAQGPQVWRWYAAGKKRAGPVKSARLAVKRVGDETIYEAAIPWRELTPMKPRPGHRFGVAVQVNDEDGTGRVVLAWGGGIAGPKSARLFNNARLG